MTTAALDYEQAKAASLLYLAGDSAYETPTEGRFDTASTALFDGHGEADYAMYNGKQRSCFIVERFRGGEAAPSLSTTYRAWSYLAALRQHFNRYPDGIADDTVYRVSHRSARHRFVHVEAPDARKVWLGLYA